jgi:hypothetical protein
MTGELTIDEIAERLVTKPSLYLHCSLVDRVFEEKPSWLPTLTVVRARPFDYTATVDRAGASVPPPGRDWSEFGRRGDSTFYRRPIAHEYFADEASVSIHSRRNDARELEVLDAVVRGIPERGRKLIDRVFCDSKHGWVITIDLAVADAAVAASIGQRFAAGMEEIVGGHGGIYVTAGREGLYRVEPYGA